MTQEDKIRFYVNELRTVIANQSATIVDLQTQLKLVEFELAQTRPTPEEEIKKED